MSSSSWDISSSPPLKRRVITKNTVTPPRSTERTNPDTAGTTAPFQYGKTRTSLSPRTNDTPGVLSTPRSKPRTARLAERFHPAAVSYTHLRAHETRHDL